MQDFYDRLGIHAVGAMGPALSAAERRIEAQLEALETRVRADVSPFADMTERGQKERYEGAQADPDAFARAYLPHYCTAPPDAFHRDLDAIASGYVPEGQPEGEAYIWLIHGPREHAKSVRVGRAGLLRQVLLGRSHYPNILSEHLYLAQAHLDYLLVELAANVRVSADFEVDIILRDRSSGTLRIDVTPRATGARHLVQIDTGSYGRSFKGRVFLQHRPDWVLIDDFENTRTAKNEEISKAKADWIVQEVYPGSVGPVIWLGNVGHDTSALYRALCHAEGGDEAGKRLMQRGTRPGMIALAAGIIEASEVGKPSASEAASEDAPESPSNERRASGVRAYGPEVDRGAQSLSNGSRTGEGDPGDEPDDLAAPEERETAAITALVYRAERLVIDEDGEVSTEYLWPSRYTPGWYARKRRTMGPFKYEGEFNGFPSRDGDVFKREWLDAALYDALDLETAASSPEWRMFSWLDPAFGEKGTACYKAIAACGSSGTDVYVVDAYVRNDESVYAALVAWHQMFERHAARGLLHGQYENDFGQDDRLAVDIQQFEADHGHLNVSGDSNRRGSKDARIESMQPLASNYRLRFPRRRTPDMERLFNQVLAYPSGAVDGPDALESCIARLRRGAGGTLDYRSLGERRYKRRGRRVRR
jgi:hypothetical protein